MGTLLITALALIAALVLIVAAVWAGAWVLRFVEMGYDAIVGRTPLARVNVNWKRFWAVMATPNLLIIFAGQRYPTFVLIALCVWYGAWAVWAVRYLYLARRS